ncbi:hypothetical protein PCASD_10616 [Puccinia coronata f. sp. avenae]|uniref:Uncharacterized protein n=1 Tax=Puccinia coronata f. sp. avenae TaxID=200324 RepID=A0A2N5U9B9_9BASI|nr:hypothetical protein PCASD_10616 [Puccinia coronata f. sp. avenae]
MDGNCGEHYDSESGHSHNSHPNLGYDHPPPGNQHHGHWYNPHAYGGHPNPYGGHGYYDEFEHGLPNGIGLTNNRHHLGMGPDMRDDKISLEYAIEPSYRARRWLPPDGPFSPTFFCGGPDDSDEPLPRDKLCKAPPQLPVTMPPCGVHMCNLFLTFLKHCCGEYT